MKEQSTKEPKTFQVQIPEGHEIDIENSILAEGKIVFKAKKLPTYDDVIRELYHGGTEAWLNDVVNYNADPVRLTTEVIIKDSTWDICTSKNQAKKLKAINMLLNVAKYLNGDWKPDWSDRTEHKYYYYINGNDILIDWAVFTARSAVLFKSQDLAVQAAKILGEDVIKQALSSDW